MFTVHQLGVGMQISSRKRNNFEKKHFVESRIDKLIFRIYKYILSITIGCDVNEPYHSQRFVSWRPDWPVIIRRTVEGPLAIKPVLVMTALDRIVKRYPDHPAFGRLNNTHRVVTAYSTFQDISVTITNRPINVS